MRSRIAERLVTGPLAQLLAGALDVTLVWGAWGARTAWARVRSKRGAA